MMMIHKWIESLPNNEVRAFIDEKISGYQFIDAGNVYELPYPSEDFILTALPPYPAVALQTEAEVDGKVRYAISFIRYTNEIKDFFVVATDETGKWGNSKGYRIERNQNGEWFLYDKDETDEAISDFCSTHLSHAIAIFAIMACSNVKQVTHEPPAALNKKRVKNGKVPLVSYKTLELIVPSERSQSADLGGTHASPRIHLRRGHIRRLESGKTVWVQPCVVGSKHGIVHKDYKVTPAQAQ